MFLFERGRQPKVCVNNEQHMALIENKWQTLRSQNSPFQPKRTKRENPQKQTKLDFVSGDDGTWAGGGGGVIQTPGGTSDVGNFQMSHKR